MLEIHSRPAVWRRRESNLDLTRPREIGFIAPLVRDLPGEHQPMRRFPDQYLSPVALGPVFLQRVTTAARVTFDDPLRHRRLADVMRAWPPAVELLGEDAKRTLDARFHCHAFLNRCHDRRLCCACHRSSFTLRSRSTLFLNAASERVQKPSKYLCRDSIAAGLTA